MGQTMFRHKCPPEVNPKRVAGEPVGSRDETYRDHIRRQYPVPDTVEWLPLFSATDPAAKLGVLEASGREMAVVTCPDCGAEVVVTRER